MFRNDKLDPLISQCAGGVQHVVCRRGRRGTGRLQERLGRPPHSDGCRSDQPRGRGELGPGLCWGQLPGGLHQAGSSYHTVTFKIPHFAIIRVTSYTDWIEDQILSGRRCQSWEGAVSLCLLYYICPSDCCHYNKYNTTYNTTKID